MLLEVAGVCSEKKKKLKSKSSTKGPTKRSTRFSNRRENESCSHNTEAWEDASVNLRNVILEHAKGMKWVNICYVKNNNIR